MSANPTCLLVVPNLLIVEKLGVNHLSSESSTLGWHFLEKIVQLPLSLPLPKNIDRMDAYVDSLLGETVAQEVVSATEVYETDRHEARTEVTEAQPETGSTPTAKESEESSRASVEDEFDELFSDKNPDVREAILTGAKQLDSTNPRQIKRFVNVFRFYTFIQAQHQFLDAAEQVSLSEIRMEDIAKLAAMVVRWPHLLATFAEPAPSDTNGRYILAYLEDVARGKKDEGSSDSWDEALAKVMLTTEEGRNHRSDFEGLRRFLSEGSEVSTVAGRFL